MTELRSEGVIVSFHGPDGLGEIRIDGGEQLIFGLGACVGWASGKPDVGLRVRVSDVRRSVTGRLKAYVVESLSGTWQVTGEAEQLEDDVADDEAAATAPWLDPETLDIYMPRGSGLAALPELTRVPWDELEHAYTGAPGATRRVPNLLRGLVSADEEVRNDAYFDGLLSVIWHQGSVFVATAHALPFLAAMLADPKCPARDRVGAGVALILRDAYLYGGATGSLVLAAVVRADDLLQRAVACSTEPLREACTLLRRVASTWRWRHRVHDEDLNALGAAYETLEGVGIP